MNSYVKSLFGGCSAYDLKQNIALYRLISAPLLQDGFLAVFGNTICLMITGFFVEALVGPFRIAAIYLVSSIGGILFACATEPVFIYTGFTSMGFIASIMSFIIMNWIALERQKEMRCCMLGMTIVLSLFWLLRGAANS